MNSYIIKSWRGGLSDEDSRGIKGSFKYGQSLSIHKRADTLSCGQKMIKESGTIVTDLILWSISASDGNSYHFGDTGKIYKRTSAGVWSLVYTDANGKINGAEEWNGNLYWATDTNLSKKPFPGASDWSDVSHNWQVLDSAPWHSMVVGAGNQGDLFICNNDKLAMVDYSGVFTNEAVKIIPGNIIQCLISNDEDIIFGSKMADSEKGYLWAWNTLLQAWRKRKKIPVKGVNALVMSEIMIAQAGSNGETFFTNFVNTLPIITFPDGGQVNPGGVTNKGNLAMFGVYGSDKCGIYSYGRTAKNRPFALNLDYVLSPNKLADIEIGAIKVVGDDLLASWKDGTTYGVDVVDQNNKANAIFEGLDFDGNRPDIKKQPAFITILTKPLPTGCSIKAKYRIDKKGDWIYAKLGDGSDSFSTEGLTEAVFNVGGEGTILEVGVELFSNGNDSPEVLNINLKFNSRESL